MTDQPDQPTWWELLERAHLQVQSHKTITADLRFDLIRLRDLVNDWLSQAGESPRD